MLTGTLHITITLKLVRENATEFSEVSKVSKFSERRNSAYSKF